MSYALFEATLCKHTDIKYNSLFRGGKCQFRKEEKQDEDFIHFFHFTHLQKFIMQCVFVGMRNEK